MKLSSKTLELLKNFSTLNQGMLFLPGKQLKTMNTTKTAFAQAVISEEIPRRFAIYSLPELLAIIDLFNDPEIEFEEKYLTIKEGDNTITYYYASEAIIIAPPEGKNINMPSEDYSFHLSEAEISRIQKTAAIMKFDTIGVSQGGIRAFNSKTADSTSNVFKMSIAVQTSSTDEVRFKIDDLKMIAGAYAIDISSAGIARITNVDDADLIYYIPLVAQ